MKFKMKLPVCIEVEFTVTTEDNDSSYEIMRLKAPTAAAVRLALSSDEVAISIEEKIATRAAAKRGLVG